MKSRYSRLKGTQILFAAALVCGAGAIPVAAQEATPAPAAPQAADPLTEVRAELIAVQSKLQAAEQKAASRPEVIEKREKFSKAIDQALIEKEPQLEPKLRESQSLVKKLQNSSDLGKPPAEQSEEFTKDLKAYQAIEQEVSEKRNDAIASEPGVQSEMAEFQKVMVEEMTKVEPETPQLLAKQEELAKRFRDLQSSAPGE